MKIDYSVVLEYWPHLLHGLWLTVLASVLALVFAPVVGTAVALCRLSRRRSLSYAAITFVEVIRDLPFVVILFLVFYLLPALGLRMPAFAVGVITLSLYAGGYFSEIVRGAIESVPKGQMESARATGMSRGQAFRRVIFPQMMGYFLPPATSQAVLVVKESSVLSTITVVELTMSGNIVQSYTYSPIEVYVVISLIYWVLCSALSRTGLWLEVVLQPYRLRGGTHA